MKKAAFVFFAIAVVLFTTVMPAFAHWRAGIWIGPRPWRGPWWGPPAYPYPYYVIPTPPAVVEQAPPVYDQQSKQPAEQEYYWYYCEESKTYYPYVKHCPQGWTKVLPTPPAQQ